MLLTGGDLVSDSGATALPRRLDGTEVRADHLLYFSMSGLFRFFEYLEN